MTPDEAHSSYGEALALCRAENPNLRKAHELLFKSSDAGDLRATYALATWYLFGNEVVERDEKRGVDLLKSLEHSNIAEAIFDLAVSYDYGKSVRKSTKKAFSLYMRAALLGDKGACDQIAQFYLEGKFVPHDKALAHAWRARAEQPEKSISPPFRLWVVE
jgi:TPR repeat protein